MSGVRPQVNQIESHPFLPNQLLVDFCLQNSVLPMAYCPLARGRCLQSEVIQSIAEKREVTGGQVALKWLLSRGLAVIPMTSRVERLRENLELGFELSEEEVRQISALNCGQKSQRISLLDKHKINELKEWPFNESQQ